MPCLEPFKSKASSPSPTPRAAAQSRRAPTPASGRPPSIHLEATSADHERRTSANEAQLQEIKTQFLAIEAKLAAATTLHQIQALKVQSRQALANLNV